MLIARALIWRGNTEKNVNFTLHFHQPLGCWRIAGLKKHIYRLNPFANVVFHDFSHSTTFFSGWKKKQHRSHATLFQRGPTQKFSFSIKISFNLKLTSNHKWELAYLGACQSVCCVFFTLKIDFSFIHLVQNGND